MLLYYLSFQCVENISRSHCPVCLGDIHTSRIPCHIPDCGHLLHKMCFDQLLASGHYTCPTCQTSLIDMTALWEYLDAQALRMPVPLKYENQRVHIFCNDCHKVGRPINVSSSALNMPYTLYPIQLIYCIPNIENILYLNHLITPYTLSNVSPSLTDFKNQIPLYRTQVRALWRLQHHAGCEASPVPGHG